ncbi:MAG: SUMF1/EgtB/PvdO family nonheme iron enzyme, partial [Myxococcota bacterium]|nr:SUMF1/EgtB/PvdO family nonheme iron enzyme [Myxococcota bacterium]
EGWAWRSTNHETWLQLADLEEHRSLVFPNQPVVGVTFHEALAYACSHGARLPTMTERRWIVRGAERRPYPWGQPFGSGNANTREEALGKPCAVGLYRTDATPDGVCDLAGNVAEWTLDGGGDRRVIHPGSWVHPAMASWAKALEMLPPDSRVGDLGFRLVRE